MRRIIFAMLFLRLTVAGRAGTLTDSFATNVNYLANGVAGTIWDGVYLGAGEFANEGILGPGNVLQCDANLSNPGNLSVQSFGTAWEKKQDDGFYLFKVVKGDFSAVVHMVTPYQNTSYNTAGLQARAFAAGGNPSFNGKENYVSWTRFDQDFNPTNQWANYLRSEVNGGVSQINPSNYPNSAYWLRMDRVGNNFSFYERTNNTDPWIIRSFGALGGSTVLTRNDLSGQSLQVGIMQATFNTLQIGAQFSDFSITATNFDTQTAPPSAPTGLIVSTNDTNSISLSWTAGSGSAGSLVVVYAGSNPAVKQAPVNGATYNGGAYFGTGDLLLSTNYSVVYSGPGTSVTVTNLNVPGPYQAAVFSYAGSGSAVSYNRNPATAGFTAGSLASLAGLDVQDIFGRSLNTRGPTLVDWDGYMANPLILFYVFPPTNALFPGSATLTANGARLYFDSPSTVGTSGPSKTISLTGPGVGIPVNLSVFPDRDSADEDYTLTIVFTGANNATLTNTIPIHVIDQDLQRTNDFVVTENFDQDVTGFFANPAARALVTQASDDWAYFFADMNLDPVAVGTETTFIWSNNFSGGYYVTNTNSYRGYQLYSFGTTNSTYISGGQGSYSGPVQSSGGVPLSMKRSGTFATEILGNYNTLGWLYLTNDNDWLVTGNLGSETNDFYSIAHHEIGHALIFDTSHPGFVTAKNNGAFTSAAVTNYFGGPVQINSVNHLTNAIDPESGQGAFGYEYFGNIPRKRWLITKLDLLCAQEVGYTLRSTSAFAPLVFPGDAPADGAVTVPYYFQFSATGGIPFYDWEVVAGALPPGLNLDPFTGVLSGMPATNGVFDFSINVRDYHTNGPGVAQSFSLSVTAPPPVRLDVSIIGQGTNSQTQLLLTGTTGQQQIIQASTNLTSWIPIATNAAGTNLFQYMENNPLLFPRRYYRAVVVR